MPAYDREVLVNVLVYHWPTASSGCWCGWAELGRLLPDHIADVYEQSVDARSSEPDVVTWNRGTTATGVCDCTHFESEHRIDLKRMACNRGGCTCLDYEAVALAWTERRIVIEPLEQP